MHSGRGAELVSVEVAPGIKGIGALDGTGVDMQEEGGFDGVRFDIIVGGITATSTFDAVVEEADLANFSGATNVADAAIVQISDANANNIVASIDVFRPAKRYVRLAGTVAAANSEIAVIATRYRAQGRSPVDLPTDHQYVSVRGM